MCAAVHFNEAWTICCHHDLSVGWSISDLQCIEHTTNVWNQYPCLFRIRWYWYHTMVHKCCPVDGTFVINPDHDRFMNTIDGHVVHDILLTLEKFLTQDCRALASYFLLRCHEMLKMLFRLIFCPC